MPTDHAILAPSASKRWMTCTPSARLEAREPQKDTAYTREGTIAHSMAEALLRGALAAQKDLKDYNGSLFLEWPAERKHVVEMGGADLLKAFAAVYCPVAREHSKLHARHEDHREFKPLGGMQGHQSHGIGFVVFIVDISYKSDAFHEALEREFLAAAFGLLLLFKYYRLELHEVFYAAVSLDAA